MDRLKRIGGGKAKGPAPSVRKDEDESLIFFGELYRREKERDVNLLEPMYSVEFEAFQGLGHMFKLPSGKRDFVVADGEKHDYDWLKTPPATPLFPSLEMEPNSSKMVFQKEIPILPPLKQMKPNSSKIVSPRDVSILPPLKQMEPNSSKMVSPRDIPILPPLKPSRLSSKPQVTKTAAARSESPTRTSSKTADPSTRPDSSSKKNIKETPALSKEQNSAYKLDKRSSYTALTGRQHNATPTITYTDTKKKSSEKKPARQGTSSAVKKPINPEFPDKAPRNLITTVPVFPGSTASMANARSVNRTSGLGDLKLEDKTRRLSCPPSAARGGNKETQSDGATSGRTQAAGGSSSGAGSRMATEAVAKPRRRTGGENDQRPKHGSHTKK